MEWNITMITNEYVMMRIINRNSRYLVLFHHILSHLLFHHLHYFHVEQNKLQMDVVFLFS